MKFTEKVGVVLCLIGISMRLLNITGGTLFVFLSLLVLACMYLFLGFIFYNDIRLRNLFKKVSYSNVDAGKIFIGILTGILHFIMLSGINFRVLNWPAHFILLCAGFLLTFIYTIIILILHVNRPGTLYFNILVRSAIMLVLALVLILAPGLHFERNMQPDYKQKTSL